MLKFIIYSLSIFLLLNMAVNSICYDKATKMLMEASITAKTDPLRKTVLGGFLRACYKNGPNNQYCTDGISHGHEGCVKGRSNAPNNVIADETSQHENIGCYHEIRQDLTPLFSVRALIGQQGSVNNIVL